MNNKLLIIHKFLIVSLVLSLNTLEARMDRRQVTLAKPMAVASTSELSLVAEVVGKLSESNGRLSYRLSVKIPRGLIPAVKTGSFVGVTLPTIHQSLVNAQIVSLSSKEALLVLDNQVQRLEGQKLKVDLPVKSQGLFKIPFQSIVSSRGDSFEVYIVSAEMKVQSVQVSPIQVSSDGNVIVASEHLKNSSIVVQGTDNLLSGDSVQINKESGALL